MEELIKTMEIQSTGMLEPTVIKANVPHFLDQLNLAAAQGKQFIVVEDVEGMTVLLETRNIARVREIKAHEAFI